MKPSKTPIYLEFKETTAHLLDGEHGAEFPIERAPDGRLTPGASDLLANALRGFLSRHGGTGPRSAVVAIPGRGVTLRTISLPGAAQGDPGRLLMMQVEAQFPVPPSELAWGYLRLRDGGKSEVESLKNFVVAAVKKKVITDYIALLSSCGLAPTFTVAALARAGVLEQDADFSMLEIGVERSELLMIDQKGEPSLRVVSWGKAKLADVDSLQTALPRVPGGSLYLSSVHFPVNALVPKLVHSFGARTFPTTVGPGITAATAGLRRQTERGQPLLILGTPEVEAREFAAPRQWKWAAAAAILLMLSISLRYAEAVLFQPSLSSKLGGLAKYRSGLPKLDKELAFLTYIKTNQPPYLDVAAVVASAAPPGTRLDQLSIARRGDVTLRGSMQDPQGPETFRSKLIAAGFFSKVVVEEQVAVENPPKVNFRISALLKPDGARPLLPPEPPKSTNQTNRAAGPKSSPGKSSLPAQPTPPS